MVPGAHGSVPLNSSETARGRRATTASDECGYHERLVPNSATIGTYVKSATTSMCGAFTRDEAVRSWVSSGAVTSPYQARPDLSLWIKVLHQAWVRAALLSMLGLQGLPNTFTTATALARGVHPRVLYTLRDSGHVVELSRGVFRRADAPLASEPDLLAVAYRSPVAIVCCRSAAAVHELSDEFPPAVQIAVPTGRRPPRIAYPPTEVFRFAAKTFEVELSCLEAAPGEWIRIYTPARTVIDLMRLRHRFGESLALAALHRYLRRRDAAPAELLRLASMFNVAGPVRRALDVATAE